MLGHRGTGRRTTQWVNHEIPFNGPGRQDGGAGLRRRDVRTPGTCSVAPIRRRRSRSATRRCRCSTTRRVAGCTGRPLHQRLLPQGDRVRAWTTTGSRSRRSTSREVCSRGELAVAYRNSPEIKDFLDQFSGEEFQCAMGGDPGLSRLSPNVNVGQDCYANPVLADASEVLAAALKGEGGVQAGFDASDQMPPEVGSGSFWTGHGASTCRTVPTRWMGSSRTSRPAGRQRSVTTWIAAEREGAAARPPPPRLRERRRGGIVGGAR